MNKALPWNTKGAAFDARDAARKAADRQGKSLGEWLHGVIADHAADLGVEEHEMGGQQRINAVTSKLERLSARSADHDRRSRTGRGSDATRRRAQRDRDEERDDQARPTKSLGEPDGRSRRDHPAPETTEVLLEEAIAAMERRAQRAEEHTDNALQSFTKLIERNEEERNRERDSVTVLAQKLSDIETRLTDRITQTEVNPIKGALERLEARLDTMGRRETSDAPVHEVPEAFIPKLTSKAEVQGSAEQPARMANLSQTSARDRLQAKLNSILQAPAGTPPRSPADFAARRLDPVTPSATPAVAAPEPEAFQRLQDKLSSIAEPVRNSAQDLAPQTSAVAITAPVGKERRLGQAIAEITARQRKLEGSGIASSSPQRLVRRIRDDGPSPEEKAIEATHFSAMQNEISTLATTIENLRLDVAGQRKTRNQLAVDIEALRAEVVKMVEALRDLGKRGDLSGLKASFQTLTENLDAARRRGVDEARLRPIEIVVGKLGNSLSSIDPSESIAELETDLQAINGKIVGLSRSGTDPEAILQIIEQLHAVRDLIATTAAKPLAVQRIEHQIDSLNTRLDRQVQKPESSQNFVTDADELQTLIVDGPDRTVFAKIKGKLEAVAVQIDQAIANQPGGSQFGVDASRITGELSALEKVVRELSEKLDSVQLPGASNEAFDGLQKQVAILSEKFETSESGLSKLTSLEKTMQDLFKHIEETRASVEVSAEKAARNVLRIATEDGRGPSDQATAASLATMQALQREAEARTASTLKAVHGTLEKVVDRLAVMEADISETRRLQPASAYYPPVRQDSGLPDSVESVLDQVLGHRPGHEVSKEPLVLSREGDRGQDAKDRDAEVSETTANETKTAKVELDAENGRADFIAAARRAAKVAQIDMAQLKKTVAAKDPGAIRAGLAVQSRDYVKRHKRQVLLSFAALLVIAGTLAILKMEGIGERETQTAAIVAPEKIASALDPTGKPVRLIAEPTAAKPTSAEPAAAAKAVDPKLADTKPTDAKRVAPIAETDPIQTGSIPALPSFAAAGPASPPKPIIPSRLMTMADAGSSAAEYALGVRYADGNAVPRDFAAAAKWYQKAADQNVAPAQYRLASLYEKGLGVPQDKNKAKSLYLKAAEAGNPRAMHNLAVLLADGNGKPDYDGAATWFRKAAQYGIHDSQYNLGILLARGIGVKQSLIQSYQWFSIAAAQGDTDAAKKRDEVGTKLRPDDISVAKALATSFQPRNADDAATDVKAPPGGWDGASAASTLNSPRSTISSL